MNIVTKTTILALALVLGLGTEQLVQGGQQQSTHLENKRPQKKRQLDNGSPTQVLFKAIKDNDLVACAEAITQGADVNAKDNNGWTPLHHACWNGYAEIVKLLLADQKIDVNAIDKDGRTSLHCACLIGRAEIVKLLLDKDADVKAVITDGIFKGRTPLHWACYKGRAEIVKLLLVAGVVVTQNDIDGIDQNNVNVNELRALLQATMHWEKVHRGEQVDPQQVQYLSNTPDNRTAANRVLPLLLRPGLANTILASVANRDQNCLKDVLRACMTYLQAGQHGRIFGHLDNPDYPEEQVASVAFASIRPYVYRHLSKQDWVDGLKGTSASFKKRLAKLEAISLQLMKNLESPKGTKPDVQCTFDDIL